MTSEYPQIELCTKCHGNPRYKSYSWCSSCWNEYNNAYARKNYSYKSKRDANLRQNHNMSLEEYDLLFFQQSGLCAICNQPEKAIDYYTKRPKQLAVDHHHGLGQNRGLLCVSCNVLVRFIEEDRSRVRKAVKYLKKHDM